KSAARARRLDNTSAVTTSVESAPCPEPDSRNFHDISNLRLTTPPYKTTPGINSQSPREIDYAPPLVVLRCTRAGSGNGPVARPSPRPQTLSTHRSTVRYACRIRRPRAAAAECRQACVPRHDSVSAGPALHEPGPQPGLWLQSCRGWPCVRRSGPPGSESRDGPLGHGAGARSEHQRADGTRGRAEGTRPSEAGAGAEVEGVAARARFHRCTGGPLHRQPRESRRGRSGLCGRDASAGSEVSGRRGCEHAVCRVADGSQPLELLVACGRAL